jgi:2'-5' RNA ligase
VRLFIALDVPDAWRQAAAAQQDALVAALPPEARRMLRPVRPELMHLTLRFLGEVDEGGVDPLQAALDGVPPFAVTLSLARAGTFGPAARTGVAWLGVGGEVDVLGEVAAEVERSARLAGLRADERPFTAHLTLARLGRHATVEDRRAVAEAVAALEPPPPEPYLAHEVLLVRSYLEGPAPRYEVLSRHP